MYAPWLQSFLNISPLRQTNEAFGSNLGTLSQRITWDSVRIYPLTMKDPIPSMAAPYTRSCILTIPCPEKNKNAHYHHHKNPGLGHLARSVSRFTVALSNVSSVSQLFSFLVGCSGMILKGFGIVTFFCRCKSQLHLYSSILSSMHSVCSSRRMESFVLWSLKVWPARGLNNCKKKKTLLTL